MLARMHSFVSLVTFLIKEIHMSHFAKQSPFYTPEMLETLVRGLLKEDSVENNKKEVLKSLDCIMDLANVLYRELEEEA